ncbi:MAG: efflux RND transporter periplasmic adaptor subunit [Cyanobacteriota bacterium]|nr:efflux RND transporter periplasmic adaptor subunit [Cyanobacteriota bacterium]
MPPALLQPARLLLAASISFGLLTGCRQPGPQRRLPTVISEPVRPAVFRETVETIGTLEARDQVQLAAQAGGRVQRLLVAQGDRVQRGALLLVLDQTQLRAEVASLRAQMQTSRLNYQRYADLVRMGAVSAIERDQYRQAYVAAREALVAREADLAFKDLRAPIDGTIGELRVKPGDVLVAGSPLAVLLRNDRLLVRLDVPAEQADRVRPGQGVELLDAGGRVLAQAVVSGIDPLVIAASQALLVRAELKDRQQGLRAGMRLNARLLLERREWPAVPFTAVISQSGQFFVYRVGDLAALKREPGQVSISGLGGLPADSRFALQTPVRLGPLQNSHYPVLSGLASGQPVITSGVLNLRHGAPVKVAAGDPVP